MSVLSIWAIRDRITDDIDWFVKKIKKGEKIDKILINPKPKIDEKRNIVTIDLHVGNEYNFPIEKKSKKFNGRPLKLSPGQAINVITKEYIGLPPNIVALVVTNLGHLILGLSHVSTHVDPGFHGRLIESVANLDRADIEIKPGDSFCSLMFLEVKEPTKGYKGDFLGQKGLEMVIDILKKIKANPSFKQLIDISMARKIFGVGIKPIIVGVIAAGLATATSAVLAGLSFLIGSIPLGLVFLIPTFIGAASTYWLVSLSSKAPEQAQEFEKIIKSLRSKQ